jgi:hypothetical protein
LYVNGLGGDGERGNEEDGFRCGAGAGAAAAPSPPPPSPKLYVNGSGGDGERGGEEGGSRRGAEAGAAAPSPPPPPALVPALGLDVNLNRTLFSGVAFSAMWALFSCHTNPKYFLFHSSHRIFRHMYGALNVGKKDN